MPHECSQQGEIATLKERTTRHNEEIETLFNRKPPNGYVKWFQLIGLTVTFLLAAISWAVRMEYVRASEDKQIEQRFEKKYGADLPGAGDEYDDCIHYFCKENES